MVKTNQFEHKKGLKKLLIVTPHFPPINAADIHRVRHSLPYFEAYGYHPIVLTVLPEFVDMGEDALLERTIPDDISIHRVRAYTTNYGGFKIGNLGLRAFYQLYEKGNELLKSGDFDLIYFSTTVFACMPLGRLWKKKFKVPFVIDMQDPWKNDYYLKVPYNQRPPKFWFSHRLNTYLERYTIPKVDGLLSVSKGYIDTLKHRYPKIHDLPSKVLTFGASEKDFELLRQLEVKTSIALKKEQINIVSVGRGGQDLRESVSLLLNSFKKGLEDNEHYKNCHFWFIGTSYAPDGKGKKTIDNIAVDLGIGSYVTEITNRQPYFEALSLLEQSDIIFIPGSSDKNYTPSKLYPDILAKKPMLCVLHSNSNVVNIMQSLNCGKVVLFDQADALKHCRTSLSELLETIPFVPNTSWEHFQLFTAEHMTKVQCDFFDKVLQS
ncbi:MAG: hypothetical protein R2797_03950 [Gelidibacter sp.]